jgi:hypothetical protein
MPAHTADALPGDFREQDQSLGYQRPEPRLHEIGVGRMTIREFAGEVRVTLRALRFDRAGQAPIYGQADREQLAVVLGASGLASPSAKSATCSPPVLAAATSRCRSVARNASQGRLERQWLDRPRILKPIRPFSRL